MVPSWVNLAGWALTLLVTVLLYRDARVRLRALGTQLATLSGGPTLDRWQQGAPVEPAMRTGRRISARPAANDDAPATPAATRPGDERPRRSSRPPPPVQVPPPEREETTAEQQARCRLHCRGTDCADFDCACMCVPCVRGRGGLPPSESWPSKHRAE